MARSRRIGSAFLPPMPRQQAFHYVSRMPTPRFSGRRPAKPLHVFAILDVKKGEKDYFSPFPIVK